jgi:type III secretion system YscJ/HrcJ family lipoprotein
VGRRPAEALLIGALLLSATACKTETIAHQQLEREANKIINLLMANGIDDVSKVKDEGSRELRFNVMVPETHKQKALQILELHNLPKMSADDTDAMFKEGGMIPTNEQQRAKREVGIRGDIINSLRSVPRVVDVQAVVTLPEDSPLRDPNEAKPRPKASVILTYLEDGDKAPPIDVEGVQRFVQASLPEVKSTEISVNMFPSGNIHDPGKEAGGGGPIVDPARGCVERERVIGLDVCSGNKSKVYNLMLGATVIAGVLSAMVIVAVLRAMRYRKDLTRLTAQFEKVKAK